MNSYRNHSTNQKQALTLNLANLASPNTLLLINFELALKPCSLSDLPLSLILDTGECVMCEVVLLQEFGGDGEAGVRAPPRLLDHVAGAVGEHDAYKVAHGMDPATRHTVTG